MSVVFGPDPGSTALAIREFVIQPSKVCSKEVSSASIVETAFRKNVSQL